MAYLASDNTSAICEPVMAALQRVNDGHMKSYGADEVTAALTEAMREVFEHKTLQVFPVFNGSAANCAALAQLVQPYEAILSHQYSHIQQDECGMPEFFTRAKHMGIAGEMGKLSASVLEHSIILAKSGGVHHSKPKTISVTQSTEAGTLYQPEELRAIADLARTHGLHLHMDGARIANAIAGLNCAPADITWRAGVDVLSFGGTKNGAMLAEAVIFFNEALAEDFNYRRKQVGQLASKQRFISAQLLALLEDNVWLHNAAHANHMAALLAEGFADIKGVSLLFPVQANALFVRLPETLVRYLVQAGHYFYQWELYGQDVYRLVTSFATTEQEIKGFLQDCMRYSSLASVG